MKLWLAILLIFVHRETDGSQRPMDLMADLTNDLGVCILQVQSTLQYGNIAFSPYGLASMSILLFEGATGNTALEIMRAMKLPWNTLLVRVGFRDINRHLKTYFKSDGFLRGLIMSRDDVCFHASYQKMLRLYGFDEPDTALTYPCSGFTPYSPATTVSSTTVDAVTVSSPTDNETTTSDATTVVPSTTEEVVTELTQTSQTITISNSTTFRPVDAETGDAAQIIAKTDSSPDNNLETETSAASEMLLTTMLQTNGEPVAYLSDITGSYSNMVTAATANGGTSMAARTAAMETAETGQSSTPIFTQPKTVTTQSQVISPPNSVASQNASSLLSNKTDTTTVANIPTSFAAFNSTIADELTTVNFDQLLNGNNFTVKLQADITFPTTDTRAVDQFFNSHGLDTFTETGAFTGGSNQSTISYWNSSEDVTSATLSSLFNDSSKTEINFSTFGSVGPLFSSLDNVEDFNKSTTFFSSLVDFIESTTQKMKDLASFNDENLTTESMIPTTTPMSSTPINAGAKTASTTPNTASSNSTQAPVLTLNEKQLPNASRNTADDAVGPRVLPKKSISESNEDSVSSAATVPAGRRMNFVFPTRPSNYVNVLSLKKSKSISSKYDIRAAKGFNKRVFKRAVPSIVARNTTSGIDAGPAQKLNGNATLQSLKPYLANMAGRGPLESVSGVDADVESFSVSLHAESEGHFPRGVAGQFADVRDFDSDLRKVRSYGHHHFYSYDVDWFTTSNQNVLRIPIFTYSAILPFAYVEELKSKVLEIPLDDPNYSLLLLLPTPKFGLNHLITSLSQWPIRRIWDCLRATPVYASIPKFSIISHVNLRPALYTLGVRDVFHRYRADLSVMSPDARLFIRSIEQVVTIHVDKFSSTVYPVLEKYTEHHFLASHPFLYFVLDKETGVSLVAGVMADPSKHII